MNLTCLKKDIQQSWNPTRFALNRFPHVIGTLANQQAFQQRKRNVLDMPIKLPGTAVCLPEDLRTPDVLELIDMVLNTEKQVNPHWQTYFMYLTIHQGTVRQSMTQRRPGAHIDGMQGVRYSTKMPVCHSYLISDEVPTRFYTHPFPTDLCERTQNWFYEFDRVKKMEQSVLTAPFDVSLMTAYSVHESTEAIKDTERTFMRIEFSLKTFDRMGNTKNPVLPVEWDYQPRDIPKMIATELFC